MEYKPTMYQNNPPNVFILTQDEVSNIYHYIFEDLSSQEETFKTKNYLNNLIQEKLDNCLWSRRLKLNLTRITTELSNRINSLSPLNISNINLLPLHIEYQVNQFKNIISRKSQWHRFF